MPFPIFHPNQYRQSLKRVFEMNPQCLRLAHGSEAILDEKGYDHVLDTAPTKPMTHWRVTKLKAKGLFVCAVSREVGADKTRRVMLTMDTTTHLKLRVTMPIDAIG